MLWLRLEKQRFAHLVLMPSKVNPQVRRWQNPFKGVARVVERREEWEPERETYVSYPVAPSEVKTVYAALPAPYRALTVPMAEGEKEVWAQVEGLPLFYDLTLIANTPSELVPIYEHYRTTLTEKPTLREPSRGERLAALGYWLRLRDDVEFLTRDGVKVALGFDPEASGLTLMAHFVAAKVYENLPQETQKRLAVAYQTLTDYIAEQTKQALLYRTIRQSIEQVKDVLFRTLGGRWTTLTDAAVRKRLGEKGYQQLWDNLDTIARFVIAHRPDFIPYFALEEDEETRSYRLPRHWSLIRDRILGGTQLRGRPNLIDTALHILNQVVREHSTVELLSRTLKASDKSVLKQRFASSLVEPISPTLKQEAEAFEDALKQEGNAPTFILNQLNTFKQAKSWSDLLSRDNIADTYLNYLLRLAEMAYAEHG